MLPFQIDPNSNDQAQYFNIVARLKRGVTLAMANAQLQLASGEFRRKFPGWIGAQDSFAVELFQNALVQRRAFVSFDSFRRCQLRPADRLRQRCQPFAGSRGRQEA